jgi:hypothetical protein
MTLQSDFKITREEKVYIEIKSIGSIRGKDIPIDGKMILISCLQSLSRQEETRFQLVSKN